MKKIIVVGGNSETKKNEFCNKMIKSGYKRISIKDLKKMFGHNNKNDLIFIESVKNILIDFVLFSGYGVIIEDDIEDRIINNSTKTILEINNIIIDKIYFYKENVK